MWFENDHFKMTTTLNKYPSQEPLWYIFVALNTLQGLFIFIAFTCTRKIYDSIKEKLFCCRRASANFSIPGLVNSIDGPNTKMSRDSYQTDELSCKWSKDTTSTRSHFYHHVDNPQELKWMSLLRSCKRNNINTAKSHVPLLRYAFANAMLKILHWNIKELT